MRLQDEIESVSTPEDFLPNFRCLSTLDTNLRCPICKDFFVAPVLIHIPKCCHTFCSVCIRACFNQTSNSKIGSAGLGGVGNSQRCPICKTEAHEEKIKPVPVLESVVLNWQEARSEILNMISQADRVKGLLQSANNQLPFLTSGSKIQAADSPEASNSKSSKSSESSIIPDKRKVESLESQGTSSGTRLTRSSHQALESRNKSSLITSQTSKKRKIVDKRPSTAVADSDSDIELITGDLKNPATMLPCPICNKLLRNSDMNSHLDKCLAGIGNVKQSVTSFVKSGRSKKAETAMSRKGSIFNVPEKKIPLPHFPSLKTKDFKALLQQHHLSRDGTTDTMTRRLNRYILLHNANLDSERVHRKSLKEIRDEVDEWETLNDADDANRRKLSNTSTFAVQQVVGKRKITITSEADYLEKNKAHFAHLITQAASSQKRTPQPGNDGEANETFEPNDQIVSTTDNDQTLAMKEDGHDHTIGTVEKDPTYDHDQTNGPVEQDRTLATLKDDNQTIGMAEPHDQTLGTAENDKLTQC
ncbi:hypothetical protein DFH28DRAFT_565587 [Melampsora americana]|nr:hypothetical protein DFH28DRAFT_565587 [Melampsora americana]